MLITLGILSPTWENFITTIRNNYKFHTFDELMGKYSQEDSKIIAEGRIPKHEEGEPTSFSVQNKKQKGERGHHFSRNPAPRSKNSYKWNKDLSKVQCYNFHKHDHYAHDFPENKSPPRYNDNNNRNNFKYDYRRRRETTAIRKKNILFFQYFKEPKV